MYEPNNKQTPDPKIDNGLGRRIREAFTAPVAVVVVVVLIILAIVFFIF